MIASPEPPQQKKKGGRPPGPVTRKRAMQAIRLLQRSDLTPEEISSLLLPPAPQRTPEDLWVELQRTGAVPISMTFEDLTASLAAAPPSRTLFELAPLEDGVNPVELLIYLPDAIRTCAAALAGIQEEIRELTKAVKKNTEASS